AVANIRESIVRGESELRGRSPNVTVEYSSRLDNAEVISPDGGNDDAEKLTQRTDLGRPFTLKTFLKENSPLFGVSEAQVDDLQVSADYTNPDGNLSYTHLEQRVNGIPVFAGEVKAGFDKSGRMIRVINNTAPGLDYSGVSKEFGTASDAVRAAARHINYDVTSADVERNEKASTDIKVVFGNGDWATTAEKMYFPTEPGVAVPAWRVLIWEPVHAYYVIVDASSGTMLWRKNIVEDQTQPATFNVYRNANAYVDVADNPAPF